MLVERSAPEAVTADRYALARWSKALAGSHLAEGRRAVVKRWRDLLGDADRLPGADEVEVAPFGVPDPMVARGLAALEPEAAVGLVAVANAYVGDPAVADRLAEELVDGAVSVTRRGPAVASLFAQLGDPVRALDWWEKIADASPEHPAYLLGLADAVAATGDAPRAQIHFIAAAANSGDPGAMSLLAARSLARHGADVEALSACRRALQLTAPGDEQEVLSTIARIDDELGRAAAASAAREALVEQTPERFRDAARGTWRSLRDRLLDAPADALVVAAADPSDAALALARARALRAAGDDTGACAAIERARAWNPGQVSLGVYRLRNCASDPAELAEAAAELLAVYVAGQGGLSSREHALRALAEAFDALGEAAAAAAARAELAGLERSAFPTWPISPADAYLR